MLWGTYKLLTVRSKCLLFVMDSEEKKCFLINHQNKQYLRSQCLIWADIFFNCNLMILFLSIMLMNNQNYL